MNASRHFMLNGEFVSSSQPIINRYNRGLLFGDCFSFEIRGCSSKMFFPKKFFDYIQKKILDFQMILPNYYSQKIFEKDIYLLLQKNRIYQGFEGIITVFKNENDSMASLLLSVEMVENKLYDYNTNGILLDTFAWQPIPDFLFLTKKIPFLNCFINSDKHLILIDGENNIVKTSNANIFFVKNKVIFVPKRQLANAELIIVDYVISILKSKGYLIEYKDIKEPDLKTFEEIFVVSVKEGIKWVMGYKKLKRYYHNLSKDIHVEMNVILEKFINDGE